MGKRDACIGRTTTGGGNTWHYLERHTVGGQGFNFFTSTTEDKGVTTFKACYALTKFGMINQELIDTLLGYTMIGTPLTDINTFGCIWH